MTLENIQRGTNAQRVAAGRVSASNDPSQWKNDANEQLIKGAELAAAGRTLGMSEEETLAAVSRQFRRQRRADDRVSREDVLRQMVQSAATTTSDVGGGEIKGVTYRQDDDVAFAFGEDTDYNYYEGDKKVTRADDEQSYRPNDRGFTQDEETGLVRRETFEETRGEPVEFAPQNAVRDALTELQKEAGKKDSLQQRLMGVFGGGDERQAAIARVMGRLEDDLRPDKGADAALGAEAVRRDSKRFNPEMREYNDNRAEAESQAIAREYFGGYGSGSMADENIGSIGEIYRLGASGMAGAGIAETAQVVRTANDAIKGQAARRHDGVFLDPVTNDPIAVQGPQLPSVLAGDRTPSNGSSSDALNAPQTAVDWVSQSMPDYREGGRVFGDYPQVDITLQTTNFANKVRDFGQRSGTFNLGERSSNIRSIEELQNISNLIASKVESTGRGLTIPDPENPGKSLPAGNKTISGVMNAIGMTLGEQQQFANAMHQLDAARRSSVNQNPTGIYLSRSTKQGPAAPFTSDIVFDAGNAMQTGQTQVTPARIPKGSTIRITNQETGKPQRKSIVTLLSQLPSDGAQQPFMAQLPGEKPRVNRYNRTGETEPEKIDSKLRKGFEARAMRDGKSVDETALKAQQTKAKLVQERENRDARKREEQRKEIQARTPANLRQAGRYDEADKNIAEIERLILNTRDERRAAKRRGGRIS